MDEWWQEIGLNMSNENILRKSDGFKFVTIQYFINRKRECNNKLAIDVILIKLEAQTDSPIIYCKNLNHKVRPHWDDIGEAVFSIIEWYDLHEETLNSEDKGDMTYLQRISDYTAIPMMKKI